MFLKNKDENYCGLYCSCGCEDAVTFKVEKDKNSVYVSLVSDGFYSHAMTGWARFKEKCKRIWYILRNKEYYYFSICLDGEDIKEFKKFVAKI